MKQYEEKYKPRNKRRNTYDEKKKETIKKENIKYFIMSMKPIASES